MILNNHTEGLFGWSTFAHFDSLNIIYAVDRYYFHEISVAFNNIQIVMSASF